MAHKKGAGSSDNGRDSKPKFLGVKLYGGQSARAGNIILRQRGTKFHLGENTYIGRDHTIHAKIDGLVTFTKGRGNKTSVSVMPFGYVAEVIDAPKPVKKAAAPKAAVTAAKPVAPKPEPVAAPKPAPVVEAPAVVEEIAAPVVVETIVETPVAVVEEVVAAPVVAETAPIAAAEAPKLPKGIKQDDLKIVEGIGPKIELLLHDGGIKTWVELSKTPVERLKEILEAAGSRYQMHDPGTWPKQAQYAAEGRFEELREWQDLLDGGKAPE